MISSLVADRRRPWRGSSTPTSCSKGQLDWIDEFATADVEPLDYPHDVRQPGFDELVRPLQQL